MNESPLVVASSLRRHFLTGTERLEVLRGLEEGVYPALVANRVLDEGVDLPEVTVAIVIGGLASSRQAKQRLGRILRKRGNASRTRFQRRRNVCGQMGC